MLLHKIFRAFDHIDHDLDLLHQEIVELREQLAKAGIGNYTQPIIVTSSTSACNAAATIPTVWVSYSTPGEANDART